MQESRGKVAVPVESNPPQGTSMSHITIADLPHLLRVNPALVLRQGRPVRTRLTMPPATSGTAAGCAPSTPTASAWCKPGRTYPFFLEWKRRAVNPSTMAVRLAPYLRYYSSKQPLDDHGHRPLVLVVFDDSLAPAHFLRVARREMERIGLDVPSLGAAWRNPDVLVPTSAFQ